MKTIVGLTAALIVSATFCGQANATVKDVQDSANASANCQGSKTNYDAQLRKSPLGVINESNARAYVTCTFNTLRDQADSTLGSSIVSYFGGFFINNTGVDKTVACTGVVGYENGTPGSTQIYVTKSVLVKANRAQPDPQNGYIFFDSTDQGLAPGSYYQLVSMSCSLPGGTGINDTYVGFRMDDATSTN